MNAGLFRRLIWKEYRVLRGFWLALAAFAGLSFLGVYFSSNQVDLFVGMWTVATLLPALYALGAAATLFAIEREEETREFLRTLPVTSFQLLIGKLTAAVASTLVMVACLGLVAANGSHFRWDEQALSQIVCIFGVGVIEALAWGMFFSLLTARPLLAAFLAAGAITLGVPVFVGMVGPARTGWARSFPYAEFVPWRLGVAVVVFLIDVALGLRWLDAEAGRGPRSTALAAGLASRWKSLRAQRERATVTQRRRKVGWATRFGRLCWHEARQARKVALILAGAAAAVTFVPRYDPDMIMAVLPLALMGGCVFLADQERDRFRFFAERGVSPRTVWLSRQTVWLTILLVTVLLLTIANLCVVWLSRQSYASHSRWFQSLVANLTSMGLQMDVDASHRTQHLQFRFQAGHLSMACSVLAMSYSAGQLASMYIRRGIVACFSGLWLAGLLGCWALLMLYIRANGLWSIAPIPATLLFATWLRAPDWILERKDWRARTRAAASLLVPAALLLAAVIVFRVEQIPPKPFPIRPVMSPPTPEALETAAIYRRAAEQIAKATAQLGESWLDAAEPGLALAIEASQRESCALGAGDYDRVHDLAGVLLRRAKWLQTEGKLDEALSRYLAVLGIVRQMRQQPKLLPVAEAGSRERSVLEELPGWAARPGQTPAKIRDAIVQLAAAADALPSPTYALEAEYQSLRKTIARNPAHWPAATDEDQAIVAAARWMPWERTRARRLLNTFAHDDLAALSRVLIALKGNQSVVPALLVPLDEQTAEYARTTLLPRSAEIGGGGVGLASSECDLETRRRATRLVLALVAYRLEHGEIAPTLDVLGDVGQLRDPYIGEPFHYMREGQANNFSRAGNVTIRAGQPLVWSPGSNLALGSDSQWKSRNEPFSNGRYGLMFPVPEEP